MQLWVRAEIAAPDQHAGRGQPAGRQSRSGGIGGQAGHGRAEQVHLRVLPRSDGPVGHGRLRLHLPAGRQQLNVDGWGEPRHGFLRVRANSIEGGTSEIMRNILGEQVLGLPGEPRVDKDKAWIEVPRS